MQHLLFCCCFNGLGDYRDVDFMRGSGNRMDKELMILVLIDIADITAINL